MCDGSFCSPNEIDYYHQLFTEEDSTRDDDSIETNRCDHNYIPLDGHYICNLCGIYHQYNFYFHQDNKSNSVYYHAYRKRLYFREKIRLLTGKKQSTSNEYNMMLDNLKDKYKSKDIFVLHKLMRENKYGKFSKYIHSIYYDLTKERLINLSEDDISFLEREFVDFENAFKTIHTRKYMISYNVILYHILRTNNYPHYKYILLPNNYTKRLASLN